MNTEIRFVRRNRVDERYAVAIAGVAGLASLLSPASPTSSTIADALVLILAVGAVVWAAASAPWWAIAGAGGVAGAIALSPLPAVVGFLAFLAGVHVGLFRRDDTEVRALAAAAAINALLWSELSGFHGLSALIGIPLAAALFVFGVRRRPGAVRKPAWQALAGVGVLVILSVIGVVLVGLQSREDVTNAGRSARSAVTALDDGDYAGAADLFEASANGFDRGSAQLGGPLAFGARLVPGLAQNVGAGRELSDVASEATLDAAIALRRIDPEAVSVRAGHIDIDAVAALEDPLLQVQRALISLDAASARVQSPWLAGPLQEQLVELEADLDKNAPRLQNSIDAVQMAPALLGADGKRTYLVVFTSPAEARNSTGFFGNWVELTADRGRLGVARFGRTGELNAAVRANGSDCDGCAEELLTHYGQYGFNTEPDGSVSPVIWSNITIPGHFPYAASAMASIYPDSGGSAVDGVIAMDPYVLAELMRYTGPIEVPELDATVTAADAAEFLLLDQYAIAEDKNVRVEALETLGLEAIRKILTADLPDPPALAKAFGPLVEERRLMVWASDLDERAFLNRVGMLGALPPRDTVDEGFSVAVTNASANKIDTFLERDVAVRAEQDPDGGRRMITDVTLRNTAPTTGFPRYVIGNAVNLPDGTSRLIVTFYGPSSLESITLDGEPIQVGTFTEAGWFGYRTVIDLDSGDTSKYRLEFKISDDDDEVFAPATWLQPLRR